MKKIAIIGGGAAGLMAACTAAENPNLSVILYEKNPFLGKKICITGKGRCNVTCSADVRGMEEKICRGAKFLRTALYAFPPEATCNFFESAGVPLKEERGGRIFPVSDKARDIADALTLSAKKKGCQIKKEKVLSITKEENLFRVKGEKEEALYEGVIIATGGCTYPLTGSDGDGYRFAKSFSHKVTPIFPALVPLVTKEASLCKELMGLSLKNCGLRVENQNGKTVYEDFGEMLFCHFGVSGPMILSASSYLDFEKEKSYRLYLDLKPALSEDVLDKRILSDFEENQNRDIINALNRLLPQKLILPVLSLARIPERKKVNLITKEERKRLCDTLKNFPLTVTGTRPLAEGIITRGGVDLKDINPRTMESRLVPGLFFAGEVLDADALTGGYNLQIAFSTGYLAGKSISLEDV